jgi:hypothetical protein
MKPKEKAQELIKKMGDEAERFYTFEVKACALIAVDEILSMYLCSGCQDCCVNTNYWQEVKKEINNL